MATININTEDIHSVAQAISDGITTLELMEDYLGAEIIDNCLVLDDVIYANDGNCEIEYPDGDREEIAQDYIDGGSWDSPGWVDVRTYRKGINRLGNVVECDREYHTIAIEQDEPDCVDGDEHDWQSPWEIVGGVKENPGVFGNGGGVIIYEVCMNCGCKKVTDTWAQHNGEQGLTAVSYEKGYYLDELAELED